MKNALLWASVTSRVCESSFLYSEVYIYMLYTCCDLKCRQNNQKSQHFWNNIDIKSAKKILCTTHLGCGHPRVAKEVHIFIQKNLRGRAVSVTCCEQWALHQKELGKGFGEFVCMVGWWLPEFVSSLSHMNKWITAKKRVWKKCVRVLYVCNLVSNLRKTAHEYEHYQPLRAQIASSFGENFWIFSATPGLQCPVLEFPSYRICWSKRICMFFLFK